MMYPHISVQDPYTSMYEGAIPLSVITKHCSEILNWKLEHETSNQN